jgi:hypothetical protein
LEFRPICQVVPIFSRIRKKNCCDARQPIQWAGGCLEDGLGTVSPQLDVKPAQKQLFLLAFRPRKTQNWPNKKPVSRILL